MQATQPAMPAGAPAATLDGTYRGTASVLMTGAGQCTQSHRVSDFRVRGNQAVYSSFRGKIEPDGSVQMHFGHDWIIGQFDGSGFSGQLEVDNWSRGPGCVWLLRLTRVGP